MCVRERGRGRARGEGERGEREKKGERERERQREREGEKGRYMYICCSLSNRHWDRRRMDEMIQVMKRAHLQITTSKPRLPLTSSPMVMPYPLQTNTQVRKEYHTTHNRQGRSRAESKWTLREASRPR